MKTAPFTLLLLAGLTLSPLTEAAETAETNLDQLLQGFETPADETSQSSNPALDDLLSGFDNTEDDTNSTAVEEISASQFSGSASLSSSYNYAHTAPKTGATDHRGLSRLRAKTNLQYNDTFGHWKSRLSGYAFYDASYQINGSEQYQQTLLEDMESEVELGETYLQGSLSENLDLKIGRQVVVWGKSDSIRVTDLINPIDNREPGMVDIEDLRLPLAMAKLDYYFGDWSLSAMLIPEIRFNKNPSFGSDFYPLPRLAPAEQLPDSSLANSETALALNGIFNGWDLSLYAADVYDDTPYLNVVNGQPIQQHQRIKMLGSAFNIASGSWLFKAEIAYLDELLYSSLPTQPQSRVDTLLGLDYAGFSDTQLSLELLNRHTPDYQLALQNSGVLQDNWQTAVRYVGDFLHQQLRLTALVSLFGAEGNDGGFSRFSAQYELKDALLLTGGVVTYQAGEQFPFSQIA
ncbi:MAG: ligand-binding protein SH3, partial [Gammaproteobacteria bacterium]|nr:ligand-binding protein SH3 [Gammaproteobacteria bacterium]